MRAWPEGRRRRGLAAERYGRRRSSRSRGPLATRMGAPASQRRCDGEGGGDEDAASTGAPESEKNEARPPLNKPKIRALR